MRRYSAEIMALFVRRRVDGCADATVLRLRGTVELHMRHVRAGFRRALVLPHGSSHGRPPSDAPCSGTITRITAEVAGSGRTRPPRRMCGEPGEVVIGPPPPAARCRS